MIKIKKVRHGWILYNDTLGYEAHSHFKDERAARCCMTLINRGIFPKQPYYQETCRRVLSKKDYESLVSKKLRDRYINVGGRRCSR